MSEEIRAGIDIGTNAVKCVVARVADGRILETLHEDRRATRLGEGVGASRLLSPEAVGRTSEAIRAMVDAARDLGAVRIRAGGTSAMREASNPECLIDVVRAACGITVEIVAGEEEARLSFLAVSDIVGDAPVAFFDLGGGSTEWVLGAAGRVESRCSLPVGAVRITEAWLPGDPPAPEAVSRAAREIECILAHGPSAAGRRLIATGGTVRNLVAIYARHADLEWGAACDLPAAEVARQVGLFSRLPLAQRRLVPGIEPDRADIILAGALVVRAALECSEAGHVWVTERGVRHGLVMA